MVSIYEFYNSLYGIFLDTVCLMEIFDEKVRRLFSVLSTVKNFYSEYGLRIRTDSCSDEGLRTVAEP